MLKMELNLSSQSRLNSGNLHEQWAYGASIVIPIRNSESTERVRGNRLFLYYLWYLYYILHTHCVWLKKDTAFFFFFFDMSLKAGFQHHWPLHQNKVGHSENTTLRYELENKITIRREDLEFISFSSFILQMSHLKFRWNSHLGSPRWYMAVSRTSDPGGVSCRHQTHRSHKVNLHISKCRTFRVFW